MFANIKKRLLGIAIAEDEALNAAIGPDPNCPAAGNPHYTVSQRLAEMRERGSRIGCVGCKILTWIQDHIFDISGDHCKGAMQDFPQDLPSSG